MLSEDLVGELGTSFERELFGKDEGIVTVKEKLGDLQRSTYTSAGLRLIVL